MMLRPKTDRETFSVPPPPGAKIGDSQRRRDQGSRKDDPRDQELSTNVGRRNDPSSNVMKTGPGFDPCRVRECTYPLGTARYIPTAAFSRPCLCRSTSVNCQLPVPIADVRHHVLEGPDGTTGPRLAAVVDSW